MKIIPLIGNIINVGDYDINLIKEVTSYDPYLRAYLEGRVNINGDVYNVNIYLENINNDGEMIYPKLNYNLDIYDYYVTYLIENKEYTKIKPTLKNCLLKEFKMIASN